MADESVRKLPKTSTPSTEGASTPKGGSITEASKPTEVARINTKSDAGKGSGARPVDPDKWADWWKKYCIVNGHSYVNRICKYCGAFNTETPSWMKDEGK